MEKRQIELDILRCIAMIAVIFVHVCGMRVNLLPVTDCNWRILTFFRAVATWNVPAFVMISGRFFLDPEKEINFIRIWKAIKRLIIAFIFWDIIYQIFYVHEGTYSGLNWKGILSQAVIGPYHFWFIYMLIGVYTVIPFLRQITANKKLMEYFLILFFVMSFITGYGPSLPLIGGTLSEIVTNAKFYFVLGYTGYFILGYYLYKYPIQDKYEIPLYVLGIVLLSFAGIANILRGILAGITDSFFSKYLQINVIVGSVAVYTFFVKRVAKIHFREKSVSVIRKLSEYNFGVYLIHAFIIEIVGEIGIDPIWMSPFIMVPVITALVYIASNIAIIGIRKIPVIGSKIS